MIRKLLTPTVSIVMASFIFGCSTAEIEEATPITDGAMNQPQIDKITETDVPVTAQTISPTSNNLKTSKVKPTPTKPPVSKVMVEKPKTDMPNASAGVAIEASYSGNMTETKAFKLYQHENYEKVLVRWLDKEGYAPLIKSLDENSQRALLMTIPADSISYSQFDVATKALLEDVTLKAREKDWLDDNAKAELGYQLLLDHESKTATLVGKPPSLRITGSNKNLPKKFYSAYEGETYEQALYRWLAQEDYQKIGKLLDQDETKVLKQTIETSEDFYGRFAKAATKLMDVALAQARSNEANERQGWISDESKLNLTLYLRLNDLKKEAILTSTKQPTYMFTVAQGSLKDNFLRMTDAYGWKATEDQYLAKDYKVTFAYPIVTETGNIKRALTVLLTDFPNLRGAIVPPTRTTYVMTEE